MLRNNLKRLRERRGLSQRDIARDLGVSQPAIASWENGRTDPSNEMLVRLSQYFSVSVDYLIGNDEPARASFSDRQIKLIRDFDRLPPDSQTLVWQMIRALLAGSSARAAL